MDELNEFIEWIVARVEDAQQVAWLLLIDTHDESMDPTNAEADTTTTFH